ncbi:YIP1 family protein [Paenibacillus mucilaginosus]|uniref:Yip1 domain-containing protein n=1 Tax=Paenibacillus mucilaginosus (strain KNP414) TaxID=1036673 RepID=F8FLZ0_PAEMK|nr:YIP1 family protein [Paenibacillus mucilaginosus]AEI45616.1 hypothetical protein KNP414_07106 [Paenibacillus mucilaginosus KNP414]MCG7215361.1 YIP1 family protein [Paenibacillus mucilaginosus]WDM27021.1 YIP1 family protein [Paenibacillus mucilaginosus]
MQSNLQPREAIQQGGDQIQKESLRYKDFIIHPLTFFRQLIEAPRFLMPLLLFLGANIAFAYFMLPEVHKKMSSADPAIQNISKDVLNVIAVGTTVIMALFTFIITCLGFYLLGRLFVKQMKLRHVVSLFAFAQIPSCFQLLYLSLKSQLVGGIPSKNGLNSLFSTENVVLKALLGQIDIFNLWYLILLGLAIHVLLRINLKIAYIFVCLFMIVGAVIQVLNPEVSSF